MSTMEMVTAILANCSPAQIAKSAVGSVEAAMDQAREADKCAARGWVRKAASAREFAINKATYVAAVRS